MDIQNLVSQFMGTGRQSGISPMGGLAGGAAAGGLMALLLGSKGARKFVGNAATLGGMAVLGGLAYRAFQNWQQQKSVSNSPIATQADVAAVSPAFLPSTEREQNVLGVTIIRSMIAAAKADGHIDADEQSRIFREIDGSQLTPEQKELVFDSLTKDVSLFELVQPLTTLQHKADVYLASCLVCGSDTHKEREYLATLAEALALPAGLAQHLEHQAQQGLRS